MTDDSAQLDEIWFLTLPEAIEQLLDQRPMTVPELAAALGALDFDFEDQPPEEAVDEVLEDYPGLFVPLLDDRWAFGPTLMTGRFLTHRISAAELELGLLHLTPDLDPIIELAQDLELQLEATDWPLRVVLPQTVEANPETAHLPPDGVDPDGSLFVGTAVLADLGVAVGGLVALRLTSDEPDRTPVDRLDEITARADRPRATGIQLTRVDEPTHDDGPTQVDGPIRDDLDDLRKLVEEILGAEAPASAVAVVYTAVADLLIAFDQPAPPLSELFERWNLAVDGDLLGPAGFDFSVVDTTLQDALDQIEQLQDLYELDEDEALAVAVLIAAHADVARLMDAAAELDDPGDDQALSALLDPSGVGGDSGSSGAERAIAPPVLDRQVILDSAALLDEAFVARAVLAETVLRSPRDAMAMGALAESLEPHAKRRTQGALRWLQARAREELGDAAAAEQVLREADRLVPDWSPVLTDLARYANDRGDAAAGLSLLQRADEDAPGELRQTLERYRPAPRRDLPRNAPCWCGSGRKYKQCHLHRSEKLPLSERADWLYEKAYHFLLSGSWISELTALTYEHARHAGSDAEMRALAVDGFAADLLLFEGHAIDDFVERRGYLLPADELQLTEQWRSSSRSVYEVVERTAGEVSLRDLRGDRVVSVLATDVTPRVGEVVLARVLPSGGEHAMLGGLLRIEQSRAGALIELLDSDPGPDEIVSFCSASTAR